MRIRRVVYAVAIGALLAVGAMAAPAQAGGVSEEPVVTTMGWDYPD
ncbi:hypothetical protein O7631_30785 [Micromonospora sp. WMMD967]|jgi:hypothetical protein|nr:hypothetical protein [Micromonospora sp. WMMD967]MDG4840934.1 hypothetical protein [Micromonospora sp. WMMD967]